MILQRTNKQYNTEDQLQLIAPSEVFITQRITLIVRRRDEGKGAKGHAFSAIIIMPWLAGWGHTTRRTGPQPRKQ
jgi:hypothetical protein